MRAPLHGGAISFPDVQYVRDVYAREGIWAKVKRQLEDEGKLGRSAGIQIARLAARGGRSREETVKRTMDEETQELIAIGASIGAHCQPCLTYHVGRARELGADASLIRAAMDVGHMVEKGAVAAMWEFARGVLDDSPQEASPCCEAKPKAGGERCCG